MPHVTIIGAGIAGLTAALRLLERGFHVTLLERRHYFGGKLGAHQYAPGGDFHEHSYHMYLNWYHNFWRIADEIGVRDRFEPCHSTAYLRCGTGDWRARLGHMADVGAAATTWRNLMTGPLSPADMYLYGFSLVDLLATPERNPAKLDQMSVRSFFNSRPYMTDSAVKLQNDLLIKAFACPSFLTSATSFRNYIRYSYQCPSPMMRLLRGNTQEHLFGPLERHLRRIAGGRLDVRLLRKVTRLHVNNAGAIDAITGNVFADAPPNPYGMDPPVLRHFRLPVKGDVILAVPPLSVAPLVDGAIYGRAPILANVRHLRCQPMTSLDLYFKRPYNLPAAPVDLLDSQFKLTFLDTSRLWNGGRPGPTFINVVASDVRTIFQYGLGTIRGLLIDELMKYLPFTMDDIDLERSRVQPNVMEELFINEVGSWEHRPTTTCKIPNLFLAGDYCQNPIDVVTIEGAVVSGLLAAEAIRARVGTGAPVEIIHPSAAPEWELAGMRLAGLPSAYAAKAMSTAQRWWQHSYREIFPNE